MIRGATIYIQESHKKGFVRFLAQKINLDKKAKKVYYYSSEIKERRKVIEKT